MVTLKTLELLSRKSEEFLIITKQVHEIVQNSGIKDGVVIVITAHTTTGIIVNESLPCVETDIADTLNRMVPLDAGYAHAHFLLNYGATGNNSAGHIKSLITGNHCVFPVHERKIVSGSAQDIYLVDFDGPQLRKVYIEVMGE
jgi:secondary thiamine-phosphate synthase enzyme